MQRSQNVLITGQNGGDPMTVARVRAAFVLLVVICIFAGCGGGGTSSESTDESQSPDESQNVDEQLATVIAALGLTGDPSTGRDLPDIEDPLAQLGMRLFFTKALGGDKDTACVSCHHPALGGGDGLSLPIGVGADNPDLLGPGRSHSIKGPTVPRNSPTTFNLAMWDQVLFHDGRIESLGKTPGANGSDGVGIRTPDSDFGMADPQAGNNLAEAQSRFPVTSDSEMRGIEFEVEKDNDSVRDHLAARIGDYGTGEGELNPNEWLKEFQDAFDREEEAQDLITYENIAKAIGEYERSQVFVNNPWKSHVKGDNNATSESAKRGALLFYRTRDEGGANCAGCHTGDFFTDEQFHVLATPQVGPGKGDGDTGDDDFGRFRETKDLHDLYAFRTPTLLNVEVTGPYGHAGAYATLEGIVRHMLNPEEAFNNYDYTELDEGTQIDNAETNTRKALDELDPLIENLILSDHEISDIVDFLLTLTDPCVKDRECLAAWIPDDTGPDGLGLMAEDQNGNSL